MEDSIFLEFRKVGNLIHRAMQNNKDNTFSKKRTQQNTTHLQMCVLGFLHENAKKEVFQRDIEKEFCIRRSTATEILNNLEKQNLITRESVQQDARLKKLLLTTKAKKIASEIENKTAKFEENILSGISTQEIDVLKQILHKIQENLNNLTINTDLKRSKNR